MTIITLPFSAPINTSLQVGDIIYYSVIDTVPGSNFSTVSSDNAVLLGITTGIGPTHINVIYDEVNVSAPSVGDYIMFQNNKEVNSSSIIGHYADIKLVNYSTDKIELFSIGSEVTESSK
jgi:hypothetical protein